MFVRKGNDAKNSAICRFFFIERTERTEEPSEMQRMRSKLKKIAIECGIAFSEIRLFLENHSLEFNEIWHENTSGNK